MRLAYTAGVTDQKRRMDWQNDQDMEMWDYAAVGVTSLMNLGCYVV